LPSNTVNFSTQAPSGLQATFVYDFTIGTTIPDAFTQLGGGFINTAGVALPNPLTAEGDVTQIFPYWFGEQSPDHSCEITQATASAYTDRYAAAAVRVKPDGTQGIIGLIAAGSPSGTTDACKLIMVDGGTMTLLDAVNASPLLPTEKLRVTAAGNVYTISRVNISSGVETPTGLEFVDANNVYAGASNRRPGIAWRHKHVGGLYYPPPGITGVFKAVDLNPVAPSAGVEPWMLAIADRRKWPLLIATGQLEFALG
jgi:hypothetical protein